jgi:hypothetical protein
MNDTDDRVAAALGRGLQLLNDAVRQQEAAATRIIGLAEALHETAPDRHGQLRAEAIIEACAFQDITGQSIRKVARLLRHLLENGAATPGDLAAVEEAIRLGERPLTQEEVDRLLSEPR